MIPDIKELNFPKKDGKQYATLTQATANIADMGEKSITTQVKIDSDIVPDFSQDWEVEFQGEKYIMPLRIPAGSKGNETLKSEIDLTFQHWAVWQLKRWPFVTIQQIAAGTYIADEEVASVQLNLKDFCILFGQVLEYYYGETITIDLNPAWQYKAEATLIEISHTLVWNVLIDAFHDKYGVRWSIEAAEGNDKSVRGGERYVIKVGYETTEVDHIFEYGFDGGLLKIERQVQSEEIRNIIKGRGGETNIPLRYFKDTDPNNKDFRPDPDWVEELADIYFPNLMPATFRSYVQGWKAAHISKYPGYTAVGENNAYAPWAYRKGYTDTKFRPVEFVADEITVSPTAEDKQVELFPGYSPYVRKGSSLDKYGPLAGTLDNNDDIYPTLQGTGMDIAVAVEQIESDDVAGSVESDAVVSDFSNKPSVTVVVDANGRKTIELTSDRFKVDAGKTANLDEGPKTFKASKDGVRIGMSIRKGRLSVEVETFQIAVGDYLIEAENASLVVVNALTGEERSASGIPAGTYYFRLKLTLHNTSSDKLTVTVSCETPKLTSATLDDDKWRNTFDIWVKNIWGSSKYAWETDVQYAERVWKPVLGDRQGNTAKVVFTTGALVHEDYEFTITGFPEPDASKIWEEKDSEGNVIATHESHWRITLAKSEAELEATGLYVPSTKKQGKAGDRFVFIGTEMTHVPYVVDAEIRLDDWKKDQLGEKKEIKPTFVVTTDRVKFNGEGKPDALINQLRVGNSIRLADKRFIQPIGDRAYETLYLQSITYTYREPTSEDAALNPDVEIVLGNEYATSANPVSIMQGEISSIQRQVGSISNIEQIVRAVGDRLYLRKDGISDRSLSPTEFFALLTSGDFRAGIIGGAGWGFYKDDNGNWVLEADIVNARQEIRANSLVINQITARGGLIIESAAQMEISRVVETAEGYVCYFDQREGTVANLFHTDDVAYCNRMTPENIDLTFYKRRVVAIAEDSVTLSTADVNGSGVPAEGDVIVHYGNYTDAERQYVKVRDVVGGGYERYIEGLDSVTAEGTEYYFAGRQTGNYGGRPRWFIGGADSSIEYREGKFTLNNVSLSVSSTIGDQSIERFVADKLGLGVTNLALDSERELTAGFVSTSTAAVYDLSEPTVVGENYTASVWGDPVDYDKALRVHLVKDGRIGRSVIAQRERSGLWRVTFEATDSITGMRVTVEGVGDKITVKKVKLERGMVGTDWSPAPGDSEKAAEELGYLKKALKESTVVEGGLVMASLLQLGYTTDESGYVVQSGVNGIYDRSKPGGGIAFWAGGGMADAADETSEGIAATHVVRMDGTGYMANNSIRFGQSSLELGENLVITDNELRMETADDIALSIKNGSMGFSTSSGLIGSTSSSLYQLTSTVTNVYYSPTSQSMYESTLISPHTIHMGHLLAGTTVTVETGELSYSQYWGSDPSAPSENNGWAMAKLVNTDTHESLIIASGQWKEQKREAGIIYYGLWFKNLVSIPKDGNYDVVIESYDPLENKFGYSNLRVTIEDPISFRIRITLNGSALRRFTIGSDGIAGSWGESLMCTDADGSLIRFGQYYIRVCEGGVKINRNDGKGEVDL